VTWGRDTRYVLTKDMRSREQERVRGQRERQREREWRVGDERGSSVVEFADGS